MARLCVFVFVFLFAIPFGESKKQVGIKVVQPGPDGCRGAEDGDIVSIQHDGYFVHEGVKVTHFDSNGEEPLTFTLGGGLITGLTMGLRGMCEGEVRQILIPPELAFDDKKKFPTGPPNDIPAGQTVQYDVVLAKLVPKNSIEATLHPVMSRLRPSLGGVISLAFACSIIGYLIYSNMKKSGDAAAKKKKDKKKK